MDNLTEMEAFATVVDHGGFTDAAKRMGISESAVSNHLSSLEARLGARLLNRTTRRVSATEIGLAYYDRARRILNDAGLDNAPRVPVKHERQDALVLQNAIRARSLALRKPGQDDPSQFEDGLEEYVFGSESTAFDVAGFRDFAIDHAKLSHGQLLQDLWAAFELGGKTGGFFVEFGATNGMTFSNSIMLERHFDWTGILAEPNPSFHSKLYKARKSDISTKCVHSVTGEQVEFLCAARPMLSRMAMAGGEVELVGDAVDAKVMVETITLNDLLDEFDAPEPIDFMSVDTEGSELEILSAFDFSRRKIKLISVEHNYHPGNQAGLHKLLTDNGYVLRAPALSRFDGWYRHGSTL